MTFPSPYDSPVEKDGRWTTSDSFSYPKQKIGLCILLWLAKRPTSELAYTVKVSSNELKFSDDVIVSLQNLIGVDTQQKDRIADELNSHVFLKDQIESLKMGLEYVYRLAQIDFVDHNRPDNAERTGGLRYDKSIRYSANIDIIDSFVSANPGALDVLHSWGLPDSASRLGITADTEVEFGLVRILTAMSESAVFRLQDDDPRYFTQSGIYSALEESSTVTFKGNREMKGPVRVLNSILRAGMHAHLGGSADNVVPRGSGFSEYASRVGVLHELTRPVFIAETGRSAASPHIATPTPPPVTAPFARNRIISGAPGTGKSFRLANDARDLGAEVERVVFHPATSFASFFGSLRPAGEGDDNSSLAFRFVPGPFIRSFVRAMLHPSDLHVLLIEEINRADAAAAFGDVFQLLDRDANGVSEYAINVSADCASFLTRNGVPVEEGVRLPPNLLLWATMNPADQGVTQLDSAFLRRWERSFVSIDEGDAVLEDANLRLAEYDLEIPWNSFRRRLNEMLLGIERHIPEDRLIGPFFVPTSEWDQDTHDRLFVDKIIHYVSEEVLRHDRGSFFGASSLKTFSQIRDDYFSHGNRIADWLRSSFPFKLPGSSVAEDGIGDRMDAESSIHADPQ